MSDMNKSQLKNRIIIGSANFTQNYGADSTKINSHEIKKILNLAKKNNIYKIDTAETYLKDKKIFKNINKKFKFSSKIIPNHKWTSLDFCQNNLEDHFKNLNTKKIDTLMLQIADQYMIASNKMSQISSLSAGYALDISSKIDVDFAGETTELAKGQILAQAGTAMLAQANAQGQGMLALIQS